MSLNIQVQDVYELAQDIVRELHVLINYVDIEQATPLIHKIINVLELLEQSILNVHNLVEENSELRIKCSLLGDKNTACDQEKVSLKKSFETLEDSWMQETENLKSAIQELREEKKFLLHNAEKTDLAFDLGESLQFVIEDKEKQILQLKECLMQKDRQIKQDAANASELYSQIEQLSETNRALLQKCKVVQDRISPSRARDVKSKNVHVLKLSQVSFPSSCDPKSGLSTNYSEPPVDHFQSGQSGSQNMSKKCEELKQKITNLEDELYYSKLQTEEYKLKLMQAAEIPMERCSGKSPIHQFFRLFLGMSAFFW